MGTGVRPSRGHAIDTASSDPVMWRTAVTLVLVVGSAVASAIFAYKLHQDRARDCGDFETCYGYAGAVRAFAVMAVVDVAAAGVLICLMARLGPGLVGVLAYTFAAATAVSDLTVLTLWLFGGRPPLHTLPTLIATAVVFGATFAVLTKFRNGLTLALSGGALCLCAFATFLAVTT